MVDPDPRCLQDRNLALGYTMRSAVIVGSGPNGLVAAVHLARAGLKVTVIEASSAVGGGVRTSDAILPGLRHDHCSAFHPLATVSPAFTQLHPPPPNNVEWAQPEIDCAHPLDDGTAGLMYKSIDRTAESLGNDGAAWRFLFGAPSRNFARLFADASQPVLRIPSHPLTLASFGARALMPATGIARAFRTEPARALWMGIAAHALTRLDRPFTSAVGSLLIAAGHSAGWVVARGGSQSIADMLIADLEQHGGSIVTETRVSSLDDLPAHDLLLLDLSPSIAAEILGGRLPNRVSRAYRRYRHGPGAFKVDFAIEGDVPWKSREIGQAGTVHLGGTAREVAASELAIHRGLMPDRPFVLVGQQYVADRSRSVGSVNPLWSYAHVPNGYSGDATEAIIAQIERFAPGFRNHIIGTAVRSTTEMSRYNPNYIGGDIIGGASTIRQIFFRPRIARNPYATGIPGVYLCSASTPPGAGAHGMCGANAAKHALAWLG